MSLADIKKKIAKYPLYTVMGIMLLVPVVVGLVWAFSGTPKTEQNTAQVSVSPTKKPTQPVIEIFTSPVEIKAPNADEFVQAKTGDIVLEGTEIQTGSTGRAQVVFPSGTVTRIDNNGLIKITQTVDEPESIVVTILKGRVWSRIKKLLGNETFQTETSNLVATVRGTSYGHGIVEGGLDRGTVLKGEVQMTCKNENGEIIVIPNKKALVNCADGTGLFLQEIENTDMDDGWINFNKEQDVLLEKRFGKDTYADDDEVLGTSTSITPTPKTIYITSTPGVVRTATTTPHPTSVQSSTSTTTNTTITSIVTATPTPTVSRTGETSPVVVRTEPTATLTPLPTATPIPPKILGTAAVPGVLSIIGGLGIFDIAHITISGENLDTASIELSDSSLSSIKSQSIDRIEADFTNVKCGIHTVTAKNGGGSSSAEVNINPIVCLRLLGL